ncbi:MAG: methyltransferase domain-containing protein [Acidimicrobiales bacterium]
MTDGAERWARQLGGWGVPPESLAAAPEWPWGFSPALMRAPDPAEATTTPSFRRALEALPRGGTVLDVGAGAGAASLPVAVAGGAAGVLAVDESPDMLAALADRAAELGVGHREIVGHWPEVAAEVPSADVVVCHHVAYNVADLVPFALALADHARRRVVMELTASHPLSGLAPLWSHFHGRDLPDGPTADDAAALLEETGLAVVAEPFTAPPRPFRDRLAWVAFVRRRLCLPADRDPEIDALLPDDAQAGPREVVALWWPGGAPPG